MKVNKERIQIIKNGEVKPSPILYWMNRDCRVHDNWALLYAQQLAVQYQLPLYVGVNITQGVLSLPLRQFDFMVKGLLYVEHVLGKFNIPFLIFSGGPQKTIVSFITERNIGAVVTDFSPLHSFQKQKKDVLANLSIPVYEVDTHNIVPAWVASPKLEFAAYTLRPKINALLPHFLEDFPSLLVHPFQSNEHLSPVDWKYIQKYAHVDSTVSKVDWIEPGEKPAHLMLERFLEERLGNYNEQRNNPNGAGQSNLSPYLHFGHISAQRVALETLRFSRDTISSESFLEELIVRRELSENFCLYNQAYDSFEGFPQWAKETLNTHRTDEREYIYTLEIFEQAETHDDLWNAAQIEMMQTGKMHGYMRMYWAKKILEWTPSPEEALHIAIYLNNKYELDGNDPNGYTGIAWSIGGVHDRAWGERNIFGKIRYMNNAGCKRKFDTKSYIKKHIK